MSFLRFCSALTRILLAVGMLAWILPSVVLGGTLADWAPLSSVFILLGLLAGLPLGLRFVWSGPTLEQRPYLRAGQRLAVAHVWRRSAPLASYCLFNGLVFLASGSDFAALLGLLLVLVALLLLVSPGLQRYDPARDRAILAAQLADLLRMGVPLSEGLEKLARHARARPATRFQGLPQVLDYLSQDLHSGAQLSYALSCQEYFPDYWVSLTALGERSECLSAELDRLSLLEQQRTRSGAGYLRLVISLVVVVLVGLFLNSYIRPTFSAMAEGLGYSEKQVFVIWDLGAGLNRLALLGFALLVARLALGRSRWGPFAGGADRLRELALHLPFWGPSARLEQQTLACLALLAGAERRRSLVEMLAMARDIVNTKPYRRLLDPARALQGTSLAGCLAGGPGLFAGEVVWLVRQGEATGDLVAGLELAVAYLDERRRERQQRLALWLDLGLQLFMAALVALYIFGFWIPTLGYYGLMLEESAL